MVSDSIGNQRDLRDHWGKNRIKQKGANVSVIHVVGHDFEIKVVPTKEFPKGYRNNHEGLYRPSDLDIFLDIESPRSRKQEALLHEIGHAVCEAAGVDFDASGGKDTTGWEAYSRILYATLADNNLLNIERMDELIEN